jgi:hypothetical protein
MILPASYQNGFAPRDGQPLYPSLWTGCVGAWNPGLGPSGLVLRDQSGFGNHGTLTNGPTFSASQGKYAMSFDGVDDLVDFGDNNVLNCTVSLTISMWAKRNGTSGGTYHAWVQRLSGATVGYQLYVTNSDNIVRFYTNAVLASSYAMSDTNWHHLCVTNSSSTTSFFIDGIPYGSGSQSLVSVTAATAKTFGTFSTAKTNGFIDDARIYNRALSPQEIRTLATRRGIAYEMAPRRRSSSAVAVTSYSTFRPSVLRGSR